MPKSERAIQKQIRELYEANPDLVLETILQTPGWPRILNTNESYSIHDDDTKNGMLTVTFSYDGDSWINVISEMDPEDPFSHRFRIAMGSSKTQRIAPALRILAFAIARETEQAKSTLRK